MLKRKQRKNGVKSHNSDIEKDSVKRICKMLKGYIREHNIKNGSVFVSRNGKPLDRSHIWKMLKALCETAGVSKDKVFPHNLRHLFARTYYSLQKDIIRLADILRHSF